MKRYMICDLASKLYVSECTPEKFTFTLSSDKSKAETYSDTDAKLIQGYIQSYTGLTFVSIQI